MTYKITVKKSAAKVIEALPAKVVKPVTDAIISLADVPRPKGCKKLKGKYSELWRIRIGDYRVIYTVDDEIRIVDIQDVGHRRNIYD